MEDILGGHCAVANITLRAMIDIATRSNVQNSLCQALQDTLRGTEFSLAMKQNLSYTQATMLETVRMACAPLVPHTSVRETSINGTLDFFYISTIKFNCCRLPSCSKHSYLHKQSLLQLQP